MERKHKIIAAIISVIIVGTVVTLSVFNITTIPLKALLYTLMIVGVMSFMKYIIADAVYFLASHIDPNAETFETGDISYRNNKTRITKNKGE